MAQTLKQLKKVQSSPMHIWVLKDFSRIFFIIAFLGLRDWSKGWNTCFEDQSPGFNPQGLAHEHHAKSSSQDYYKLVCPPTLWKSKTSFYFIIKVCLFVCFAITPCGIHGLFPVQYMWIFFLAMHQESSGVGIKAEICQENVCFSLLSHHSSPIFPN